MTAADLEHAFDAGFLAAMSNAVSVAADAIGDEQRGEDFARDHLRNAWNNAVASRRIAREVCGLPAKGVLE